MLGCLAGDLHFYMRHSFKPAPAPMKANGKVAKGHADGHVDNLSGSNPFAEPTPSRVAAAKVLGERVTCNTSMSDSSVASSDTDEAELGRDIYRDLASLVHNGKPQTCCLCVSPGAQLLPASADGASDVSDANPLAESSSSRHLPATHM